jgi:hypothetical protein
MKQIDFGELGGKLNQRMIIGSEVPPLSYQQAGFLIGRKKDFLLFLV